MKNLRGSVSDRNISERQERPEGEQSMSFRGSNMPLQVKKKERELSVQKEEGVNRQKEWDLNVQKVWNLDEKAQKVLKMDHFSQECSEVEDEFIYVSGEKVAVD